MEKRDYPNLPEHLPHGKLAFNDSTNELFIGAGENAPLQKVTNKEIEDELRVASIDYSGEHHTNLKDSMDANVDFVMGEFNSVQMTGEYITAQNTIPRHVKRAELKGHTEVNVIQEPSGEDVVLPYSFEEGEMVTINDTHPNGRVEVEVRGRTLVNLFDKTYPSNKPGLVGAQVYEERELDGKVCVYTKGNNKNYISLKYPPKGDFTIKCKGSLSDEEHSAFQFVVWFEDGTSTVSERKLTTKVNSLEDIVWYYNPTKTVINISLDTSGLSGCYVDINNFVIVEGNHVENDIPYFEGMASVQTPTIQTCGKNLLDPNSVELIVKSNNSAQTITYDTKTDTYEFLCPNSYNQINIIIKNKYDVVNTNQMFISGTYESDGGVHEISQRCYLENGEIGFTIIHDWKPVTKANVKIMFTKEEITSSTTYERYQSSSLTLPEEIVLRGLPNGVCDTYNTKTKEYTQRIGEIVLDGSEDEEWRYNEDGSIQGKKCFNLPRELTPNRKQYGYAICDHMPITTTLDKVGVYNGKGLNILIDSNSYDVGVLKEILASKPITVQYELAEPIVTKIDLPSLKAYNTVTHLSSTTGEGSLVPMLASDNTISYPTILKPNTKYSIIANPTLNNHTSTPISCNLGGTSIEILPDSGNCHLITTPSNLAHSNLTFTDGDGHKLCGGVMLLEGDKTGMMFNYFEGMKSVENPTVGVNNKNLISKCDYSKQSQLEFDTGYSYKKFPWIQLKPMTEYKLILHDLSVPAYNWNVLDIEYSDVGLANIYNINRWDNSSPSEIITKITHLRTTPTGKIRFSNYIAGTKDNKDANYDCLFGNLCSAITLWEKDSDDSFILKQSNALTIPTQLSLRSLPNGVCDTLDLITGEYMQNVMNIILDGTEPWNMYGLKDEYPDVIGFYTPLSEWGNRRGNSYFYLGSLPPTTGDPFPENITSNTECIAVAQIQYVKLSIYKNRLSSLDVSGFKQWLSNNPIRLQYQLAEPITTKLDLQWEDDKLFAYDGTTHFLVDIEGGHLYPVFDVDVPVNLSAEFSRLRAEKEQLQRDKDRLENQLSLVTYHKDTLYSNVQSLQTENSQLKTQAEDLQVKSNVLELKSGELEKCTTRLTQSTAHLSEGLQFVDSTREKGDLELLSSDFDLDFRLMEIEFALDLTLPAQFRTKEVRNMARTPYEMAKTLILGGKYDREDMEFKLGRYLKRGQITQEQHDELLALMEANDLM